MKKWAYSTVMVWEEIRLSGPVIMLKCHRMRENQLWEYDAEILTLRHVNSNQCLNEPSEEDKMVPTMQD